MGREEPALNSGGAQPITVNGPEWKALIEEEFGDGIMSAIDFTMEIENAEIEREPNAKGDRLELTMSGKFPPYKYYGSQQGVPEYGYKRERGGLDILSHQSYVSTYG